MSLLGRLEDLSLTDIVQIVFLSRRTGILEIVNPAGRHTVLFRQGLVVNASAPEHPDLVTYLSKRGLVPPDKVALIRKMEDRGIPCGTTAVELNLLNDDTLAEAIRNRIQEVVSPLIGSREGEFNFLLSESMTPVDVEYNADMVFKEGGFPPQEILQAPQGEKLKPLSGLEESLRAGKDLRRGTAPEEAPFPQLNVVPFPIDSDPLPKEPWPAPSEHPLPRSGGGENQGPSSTFKIAGGLFETVSPEQIYRNVVLLERNPLIRVAAKRAFTKNGANISQFGSVDDAGGAIADLFRANSFFVTFLELSNDDSALKLLQQIKRRNPRLPVVIIDSEADLRRRHDLLRAGADLYLTKPPASRLQPGMAEQELALFADELVLFASRAFEEWQKLIVGHGSEAGKHFYEQATHEQRDRRFSLLKQLINELSRDDVGSVTATILRLSAEYLGRGALFMVSDDDFVGLGGFGAEEMDGRVKGVRISRGESSILLDVSLSGEVHQGKMRKTPANVRLIDALGGVLPTEVVALPIMQSGRPVGILYGDNAGQRGPIDNMTGLEIFLSQAGDAFGTAVSASHKAGGG